MYKKFFVEAIDDTGKVVRFVVQDGKTLPGNGMTTKDVIDAVKDLRVPLSKVATVEYRLYMRGM